MNSIFERRFIAFEKLLKEAEAESGHPVSMDIGDACYMLSKSSEPHVAELFVVTENQKTPWETLARDIRDAGSRRFDHEEGTGWYWLHSADLSSAPEPKLLSAAQKAARDAYKKEGIRLREQASSRPTGSQDKFTWVPVYRRIAEKIIEYEDRQDELIAIIKEARDLKLPVISLKDKDKNGMTEMSEIDPFSFFASFNRHQTFPNKRMILGLICERLGLPDPGDITFIGIPVVNNMQSWFLPWQVRRDPGDLPALWSLARTAVTGGLAAVEESVFQRCLEVHTVGMPKLTMGLYWMRPDEFFPTDGNTLQLLKNNGVDSTFKDFKGYRAAIEKTQELFDGMSFPEISHSAIVVQNVNSWVFQANPKYYDATGAVAELGKITWRVRQNFKQIKAGDRVYIWEAGPEAGIIAVATTTTNPTKGLTESEEERKYYVDAPGLNASEYRVELQIDQVLEEKLLRTELMEDPILVEMGVIRFGNATNFRVTPEQDQAIQDLLEGLSEESDAQLCLIGTDKNLNSYLKICRELIDQTGAYASWWSFPVKEAAKKLLKAPFWLYINLGGGNFSYRFEVSEYVTSHGNKGLACPWPESAFEDYRSETRAGPSLSQIFKTWIKVTKIETLDPPLSRADLRPAKGFSKASSLLSQATFGYAYPNEEDEKPPVDEVYKLDEAMEDLFLPDDQVVRIIDLLREKHNVILQGPPGVGKTFVAKRLAHTLMGAKDEERVQMVQFHQTYSYEDFIQGYRPGPEGNFTRRDGVFYEFCKTAAQDQDNDYVFIIDEINRGNLSRIFGELMMLIERDKRGSKWAMDLTYKEEGDVRFFVPENLYLIGLMNTADRSLAMVDYALRRRFAFVALKPAFDSPVFKTHLLDLGASEELVTRIRVGMNKLNTNIEKDKDLGWGYAIGHSYFCPDSEGTNPDEEWYLKVLENEVLPLLREYWFDKPDSFHAEKRKELLGD